MNILNNIINYFHPEQSVVPPQSNPTKLIAFGNVLLDISVKIDSSEILDKFNLNLGHQGEITSKTLNAINEEIRNKKFRDNIKYGCGGSALNTIRILKKIDNKTETIFFGSVGTDENGSTIERILKENNIRAYLQKVPHFSTGQCFCFILGDQNALYANIGASEQISKEFILSSEKLLLEPTKEMKIYYIEGYFLPLRLDIVNYIVKAYINKTNILAVNLNSSYIVRENKDVLIKLLKNTTLIFGNRVEYETLADLMNFINIDQLADYFCNVSPRIKKIIVVTNGKNDVIVFTNYESNIMLKRSFPVIKVPDTEIKDTTGAGDSFVAGFLSSFIRHKRIKESIINGCEVASKVVQEVGCDLTVE